MKTIKMRRAALAVILVSSIACLSPSAYAGDNCNKGECTTVGNTYVDNTSNNNNSNYNSSYNSNVNNNSNANNNINSNTNNNTNNNSNVNMNDAYAVAQGGDSTSSSSSTAYGGQGGSSTSTSTATGGQGGQGGTSSSNSSSSNSNNNNSYSGGNSQSVTVINLPSIQTGFEKIGEVSGSVTTVGVVGYGGQGVFGVAAGITMPLHDSQFIKAKATAARLLEIKAKTAQLQMLALCQQVKAAGVIVPMCAELYNELHR